MSYQSTKKIINSFKHKQILQKQDTDSDTANVKNTLCNSSDKNLKSEEKKIVTVYDQSNQQLTYKVDVKSKKCSICEKKLSSVCSLRRHLRNVHKLKRTNTNPLTLTSSSMEEWVTNVENFATSGKIFCLPNKTQTIPAMSIKTLVTDNSMSKHMKKNETKSINLSRLKYKDKNKCFLCNRMLSDKFSLKRHLLAIHKIGMNDIPSTSSPCHSIKQKTYDNVSTIKNNLVHNLKKIHTNCAPNKEQNTVDISSKVQTCNNIMPPTMNTFSMSDELNNSCILQSRSINTQNKYNSINPSPQSNKLQSVPIQKNKTHVAVNSWPNKIQESQAQSYETVAMYSADMFGTNTCITQPSFDQFAKPCFIPHNKQELLNEKIITQVPMEKNMLLDLPVIEQNHNKMLLSVDDKTEQPNKNQFLKTNINKTRGAINKINDQSNMTNNVQMYSNGTEIIADTMTESYNQNKQQSFNIHNNIEDVFVVGWPNETQVNQIQSDQTLQNCHSHVCNICSMLFLSQQSLTEHKQKIHSTNNVKVHRDKCMFDLPNIEKNIILPKQVTMDSYYESDQSNEVHIVQTCNNELQLDVNGITMNEESKKMQTFQNYSNETLINTDTTSVLCQSNDAQAVQTDNNKTHISMNDWPNEMQEIQTEKEQTITLYKGHLLFDKPHFETHDLIDQNKMCFWSSADNKKNLSTNEFQINTDTNNVSYQPNETQTKQIHNRTNVLVNSWPNESQRVLNHSNQSMNRHKAQPLNTNAIRTGFVDWSEVSNKSNNHIKKSFVCSEQFKHKQEIHSPKQQMLEKKINQFPVDINMLVNSSFVQKSLTNANETLSYIDPNSQSSEEMPQISDYETQPVTNSLEFYDNLQEIDILQSLYNTNQIGNCTITSVSYQPNEAQTVQMLDKSQINLNNWPYETQEVIMRNDSIIHHKAQTLGTNSLKTQNSENNFVVSNDNIKLENEPKTISYSSDVCSKKFKHQKVPTNLITIKKNKNNSIIQSYRNLQKNPCYKCCKSFVSKYYLNKHLLNFHKVLDTNSKTVSTVDLYKQNTEHSDTSTTIDFENNRHSNGALEVLNIESDKPKKLNLNSAISQSTKEQTVPTFSNKSYGSVIGHSTEMKAINNHTNTIETKNSLECNEYFCQICRMPFPFVEKLMEHIRRVHGQYKIKRAKNYIPQRVNCLICKKSLSESSIRRHLQSVHNFNKSTVQALCVQSKSMQVPGNGYEPYRLLNEEQTEKTIIKDYQNPSDKCLINDPPSIVQINQEHCKKPYTDVYTEKFNEVKVLEPICKKILVHDDTCTDVNQPKDQTLYSSFNKMHVTSKTCALLDHPKGVQIPKVSDNNSHVAAKKCLVVNSPTNVETLPTFDQITQVKPQIDIVIDILGKKPVLFTKSETQSKPHEYANSSHSNAVQVPNKNLKFQLKKSNERKPKNIQKSHVCEKCTKSFLEELDYKLHLITHYSFKCDYCNIVFKSQSVLNWHQQIHTKIGLYVCGYVHCSHLSFFCQREYSEHLKSHVNYKTKK